MADPNATFSSIASRLGLPEKEVTRLFEDWVGRTKDSGAWTEIHVGDLDADPELDAPSDLLSRYEDLGPLGQGGMGEVRRVRDHHLNRTLAMKTLRSELMDSEEAIQRFVEEAQVAAQLQHPGIVSVHDFGLLPDGRVWFTMDEVQGETLSAAIKAASPDDPTRLRRLVEILRRVCEAVAFAHSRGVVHRDLKPANVMLGAHGEVLVLDWGLAKVLGTPDAQDEGRITTVRTEDGSQTRVGRIAGTPAYMPPEQAAGQPVDAHSDVYALGAMLCVVLTGFTPVKAGSVDRLRDAVEGGQPSIPAPLARLCLRALSFEPGDRPQDAGELTVELRDWLEGAQLREQALRVAEAALANGPKADAIRREAARLDAEAEAMLEAIPRWAAEEEKADAWEIQERAAELRREADRAVLAIEQGLAGALRIDPTLPEAHAALAERYLASHAQAERGRDAEGALRTETLLTRHAEALPEDHPQRRRCAVYLKGDGALSLVTDPPGARVELFRFVQRNRRLVPEPVADLGRTPLVEVPLERGSYVCVLKHPERGQVRYPVHIGRREHWDGVPPEGGDPVPVWLPRETDLDPEDCYVPAGWFIAGGDPEVWNSPPRARLWCDAMVFRRFPITHRAFIAFLDDLVARGREDEALLWVPRQREGRTGEGEVAYGRASDGRFELVVDAEGDVWNPDWPLFNVNWGGVVAFARWEAERTGRPWRLPGELEWEKAARGVDGRWYPWGDHHDPSWCCGRESWPGRALPAVVDSFPVDTSVYGVRGCAGNIRVWCGDTWSDDPPATDGGRVIAPELPDVVDLSPRFRRGYRGGYWNGFARSARVTFRWGNAPSFRNTVLGGRLARSISP